MEEKVDSKKGAQDLLLFIWQKKWILISLTVIAIIVSSIAALLMTPQFRSTAIVFPTATSTVSFSEQRNAKANSMDFGEEEQAEQMLQFLQSSRIRNRIVQKYNLLDYYEIGADDPNKNYKLSAMYDAHIQFERTRYGSILINVWDKQPEQAALIANDIVNLIDTVKNEIVKERTIPAFDIVKRKYNYLTEEKMQLEDSLRKLAKMGVVTSEARATLLTSLGTVKSSADHDYVKQKIDINMQYGAAYDGLEELRKFKTEKLTDLEAVYEQAESDAHANFNHKFVVEWAVKADKKDKPVRWIIVAMSTLGTFALSVLLLLVWERIKELRKMD
jgi:uncharacterized protein involved in exopolysaccharide biosynthesis